MNSDNSNYVYALKDPRKNPAQIFYIGKGTGSRRNDHIIQIDQTVKGRYIQEIMDSGHEVVVSVLCDNLTETHALVLEAELISAFGTEKKGGILKNSVSPSGVVNKIYTKMNLPNGVSEKAYHGLKFLKDSILEFIRVNPNGVKNNEIAKYLNLQSDNNGRQKDYLSYSILGILMKENLIVKDEKSQYKIK
jgi:hypothetical protein